MAARKKQAKKTTEATGKKSAVAADSAYPEVEALVDLMNRHGLVELDYLAAPDGTREVRISRIGVSTTPPAGVVLQPNEPAESPPAGGEEQGNSATELVPFNSPMVGTFYRAASPESSPFVNVGHDVDETTTVCIIEAMKVMNEVTPDVAGTIASIEVENGEAVEFGQPLFLLRPA